MDTLGRLLARPAAGAGGAAEPYQALRPAWSGMGFLELTSELNHLLYEAAFRTLYTGPGWRGFYAGSPSGYTAEPRDASDVDWTSPGLGARGANACLGSHWVPFVPGTRTFPRATLRFRTRAPSNGIDAVGVILLVVPGIGTAPRPGVRMASLLATETSPTWKALSLDLDETDLAPVRLAPTTGAPASGAPVLEDAVEIRAATFWVGAFNTSNKDSTVADIADLTSVSLVLEPVP